MSSQWDRIGLEDLTAMVSQVEELGLPVSGIEMASLVYANFIDEIGADPSDVFQGTVLWNGIPITPHNATAFVSISVNAPAAPPA